MKKRILFFLMAISLFLFLTSGTVKAQWADTGAFTDTDVDKTVNSDSTASEINSSTYGDTSSENNGSYSDSYDYSSSSGSGGSGFSIPSVGLPTPSNGIIGIVENILYWLLGILGFVGIIGFIISGIMYLVSTGDDELIKRAKKGMMASIIGVVVGLSGVVAMQAINMALGGYSMF